MSNDEKEVKIRVYTFKELSELYFPQEHYPYADRSVKTKYLKKMIYSNKKCLQELKALDFNPSMHMFTPKMVESIFNNIVKP